MAYGLIEVEMINLQYRGLNSKTPLKKKYVEILLQQLKTVLGSLYCPHVLACTTNEIPDLEQRKSLISWRV